MDFSTKNKNLNQNSKQNQDKISTHQKGLTGEEKACNYLLSQNYKIVERNFRQRDGEIDIIAEKDDFLVFCEVKTLPNGTLETLAHELNLKKQKKIIKTSKIYLKKHREYNNKYIRFDVLAVDIPVLDPVYHIQNAFLE